MLRLNISAFLTQVTEEEQPFGRVFDMVRDARRRHGVEASMRMDQDVLNTRNRMLAQSLVIRCELAVVSDFMALRKCGIKEAVNTDWTSMSLDADFSKNRITCENLLTEATSRDQPMQQVEALLYHARWSILERSSRPPAQDDALGVEAREQLVLAEDICKQRPRSTSGMLEQITLIRRMLDDGVFYTVVDSDEKRQVFEAMAQEFRGTGHWYTCVNGHPFTVGECGMPMQTSRCPQCNATVGGQSHQPAEGVTRDEAFEREFGQLRV